MAVVEFLSDEWIRQFNETLARSQRQVITPLETAPMRVTVTGTPSGQPIAVGFETHDRVPELSLGVSLADDRATVEVDFALLRTGLVDGRMDELHHAAARNELTYRGSREVLLYYLYSLFDGGPEGAATAASEVQGFTR